MRQTTVVQLAQTPSNERSIVQSKATADVGWRCGRCNALQRGSNNQYHLSVNKSIIHFKCEHYAVLMLVLVLCGAVVTQHTAHGNITDAMEYTIYCIHDGVVWQCLCPAPLSTTQRLPHSLACDCVNRMLVGWMESVCVRWGRTEYEVNHPGSTQPDK